MKIIGLPNIGNTCFINSVLQCFIYTQDFHDIIYQSEQHELKELIKLVNNEPGTFQIKKFIDSFEQFQRNEQHDAHEFITILLDKITTKENFSVYHGKTNTGIQCETCKTKKNVIEDFNSINLNVHNDIITAFTDYLKTELHDDPKNLYFCETCKCNTVSKKKIVLEILPKHLILVIKRYDHSYTNIENINKSLLIREQENIKEYILVSVINHYGNLYNGHYTTTLVDKNVSIDDSSKTNIPLNPYILFYSIRE
jgi:ubiquitin carboxyl-terminal hydrolase 36/42